VKNKLPKGVPKTEKIGINQVGGAVEHGETKKKGSKASGRQPLGYFRGSGANKGER